MTMHDSVAPGRLREIAFGLLLRDPRPIEPSDLAVAAGMPDDVVRATVASLAHGGWLDLDDDGRIVGSAGLSLSTGPHALKLGDAEFRTWCAYDALGISAALGANAIVQTTCGRCGRTIELGFRGGEPERSGPELLWLADSDGDLRGSFCTPTVLLCGAEHGAAWAIAHGGRGRLVGLIEGVTLGGGAWASYATTAQRLMPS